MRRKCSKCLWCDICPDSHVCSDYYPACFEEEWESAENPEERKEFRSEWNEYKRNFYR